MKKIAGVVGIVGIVGLMFVGCGSTNYQTKEVQTGTEVPLTNGDVVIVSGDGSGSSFTSVEGGVVVDCAGGGNCDVRVGSPSDDSGCTQEELDTGTCPG